MLVETRSVVKTNCVRRPCGRGRDSRLPESCGIGRSGRVRVGGSALELAPYEVGLRYRYIVSQSSVPAFCDMAMRKTGYKEDVHSPLEADASLPRNLPLSSKLEPARARVWKRVATSIARPGNRRDSLSHPASHMPRQVPSSCSSACKAITMSPLQMWPHSRCCRPFPTRFAGDRGYGAEPGAVRALVGRRKRVLVVVES